MAKTYSLQGPIVLENLSNTDALTFLGKLIDAIPSYSMGTASVNIQAQGPAGAETCTSISGSTVDALKAALQKVPAPQAASDITYDVRGQVNLVGLSFEDGIGVVDAALHAIPPDSLVVVTMIAQEEAPAK
jgi:hypothetical protein